MKKKLCLSLLVMLLVVTTAGCGGSSKKVNSKTLTEGNLYKMLSLKDTVNNATVFEGVLPDGWNSYIESKWDIVSSIVPGKETVKLSSPDGLASITIVSQEGYVENKKYNEGENTEYYTTYLHYMEASQYLDYYMNKYYSGAKFIKEMEIDEDLLSQLKAYNDIKLEMGKNDASQLNNVTPSVSISVSDVGVSASKKQYEYGSNVMEASTAVSAIKTNLNSSLSAMLSSEAIDWIIPYTIVYQAEDQEAFDKYYDDYLFIVANSHFTTDYYAMVEYVSSAIVNAYTSYYAAKSKAALDATNNYIESNYSSTSSESTNDRVMQMWDDVINEVDVYNTEDGGTIRTSMYNETVAQNGDEIYIGSKAGIPIGFNELHKDH